jgi:carboxyl-terminal processing protease
MARLLAYTFVTTMAACATLPAARPLTVIERRLNVESFDYVWTTVRDKHFDPTLGGIDWPAVRRELKPRVERARSANEARAIMEEMLSRLKQSHFGIIPAEFYCDVSGARNESPIGGTTGLDARVIGGRALVTRVAPGSPADRAGIRTGWEIVRLGNVDVPARLKRAATVYAGRHDREGMLDLVVVSRLGGQPGSSLAVTLRDGTGRFRTSRLRLAEAEGRMIRIGNLPPVPTWIRTERLDGRTGYITFNGFMDPVRIMPLFNQAMESFMDTDGLVIDLRGNGGGLGAMPVWMAGWLVAPKGQTLGTATMREGTMTLAIRPRPRTYDKPVAVLIDELAVSAAEVFAQGLKDLGRARLFGRRTAGIVLMSNVEKLPNGDGFQYVTGSFVSPKGLVLEGVGVVPDVEVRHTRESLLAGRDLVLEAAVAWIRTGGR